MPVRRHGANLITTPEKLPDQSRQMSAPKVVAGGFFDATQLRNRGARQPHDADKLRDISWAVRANASHVGARDPDDFSARPFKAPSGTARAGTTACSSVLGVGTATATSSLGLVCGAQYLP